MAIAGSIRAARFAGIQHAATPIAAIEVRGAAAVARGAIQASGRSRFSQVALVNGAAGIVYAPRGRLAVVLANKVSGGKIAEIDVIAEPVRLRELDVAVFDG